MLNGRIGGVLSRRLRQISRGKRDTRDLLAGAPRTRGLLSSQLGSTHRYFSIELFGIVESSDDDVAPLISRGVETVVVNHPAVDVVVLWIYGAHPNIIASGRSACW